MPEFDERDREIQDERQKALDEHKGPRVGDFVIFADGVERRISHLWPDGFQTSNGGSFYLGDGYCRFSGSLYKSVPLETLTLANGAVSGAVWFFHHDHWGAGRGINTTAKFRAYVCEWVAPR